MKSLRVFLLPNVPKSCDGLSYTLACVKKTETYAFILKRWFYIVGTIVYEDREASPAYRFTVNVLRCFCTVGAIGNIVLSKYPKTEKRHK
jgi:hypothetical protein